MPRAQDAAPSALLLNGLGGTKWNGVIGLSFLVACGPSLLGSYRAWRKFPKSSRKTGRESPKTDKLHEIAEKDLTKNREGLTCLCSSEKIPRGGPSGVPKIDTASVHAAKNVDDYAAERDWLAGAYLSLVRASLLGSAPPARAAWPFSDRRERARSSAYSVHQR